MLVDQDVELALKLCLLRGVGERHTRGHGRHVLDDHEAERVGGVVEQVGLDLDLSGGTSSAPLFHSSSNPQSHTQLSQGGSLTCLRTALKPSFFSSCRSKMRAS